MDELKCPICGREMSCTHTVDDTVLYECHRGHEKVLIELDPHTIGYIYLGDGCYIIIGNMDSCEKAIARMKREFYESPEYVVRVMEK